jgi:ComF family protein
VYQGLGKDMVGRLKFSGAREAARAIAAAMTHLVTQKDAVIVSVPTATSRVRLRGYDQASLIAKALARQTNGEYAHALRRVGQHRQVGASRVQRLQQMENSFIVWNPKHIAGRHIVLVDDVMTTGATLEAAATVLKAAGAKRVNAVVFARA